MFYRLLPFVPVHSLRVRLLKWRIRSNARKAYKVLSTHEHVVEAYGFRRHHVGL